MVLKGSAHAVGNRLRDCHKFCETELCSVCLLLSDKMLIT